MTQQPDPQRTPDEISQTQRVQAIKNLWEQVQAQGAALSELTRNQNHHQNELRRLIADPANQPSPQFGTPTVQPAGQHVAPHAQAPAVRPTGTEHQRAAQPPAAPAYSPTLNFDDIFSGRTLAWLGGIATLIGLVFLFSLGISSGFINEPMRCLMGAALSAVLVGIGARPNKRNVASNAMIGTGLAGLFGAVAGASDIGYGLISDPVGLFLAAAIGACAVGLSLQRNSQETAILGVLGACVLAFVADHFGTTTGNSLSSTLFLLVALSCGTAIVVHRKWSALGISLAIGATPLWIRTVAELSDQPAGLWPALIAITLFWAISALSAIGFELRAGAAGLRPSSAFILAVAATATSVTGYWVVANYSPTADACLYLWFIGSVHAFLGLATRLRSNVANEISLVILGIGALVLDVAFVQSTSGYLTTAGWAVAAVGLAAFAKFGNRRSDNIFALAGLGLHLAFAAASAGAQISDEIVSGEISRSGSFALATVAAAAFVSAALAVRYRDLLNTIGLAAVAVIAFGNLDGLPLTIAWSLQSLLLFAASRRTKDPLLSIAAPVHLAFAIANACAVFVPELFAGNLSLSGSIAFAVIAGTALTAAYLAPELEDILNAIGLSAVAPVLIGNLDGLPRTIAFAAEAVLLVWLDHLRRRRNHSQSQVFIGAALCNLAAALSWSVWSQATPEGLIHPLSTVFPAIGGLGAVAAAAALMAILADKRLGEELPNWLAASALGVCIYLASLLAVGLSGTEMQGQLQLTALWTVAAVSLLIAGLKQDSFGLRIAGATGIAASLMKLFANDLSQLEALYRVAAFLAVGLVLLAAAYMYSSLRPEQTDDMRKARELGEV